MTKITFNNAQSPFFRTLKDKVDNYFEHNNINTTGSNPLLIKSIIQFSTAILFYTILVFFTPIPMISVFICILLGINLGVLGFNVMHEGGHNTFSKYKWVNLIAGHSLNVLGGNIYFWKIKHNINHHTYTNIEGMDSDIDIEPFMRVHENQPRYWFHKFQHIYWVFLYGISYFAWIFKDDYVKYFSGKMIKNGKKEVLSFNQHLIFWLTKLSYIGLFIVLPIFMVGLANALIGFAIVLFACGLSISIVFQLAHVVEETSFPQANEETNKIETEWAIHQISTTSNFGTKSKLLYWLLGGLNFQVEHHLFPRISHIHYPAINKLVKETCEQFNVKYLEYNTAAQAFVSHLRHIKRLGRG